MRSITILVSDVREDRQVAIDGERGALAGAVTLPQVERQSNGHSRTGRL
jgi:hypothetical protein